MVAQKDIQNKGLLDKVELRMDRGLDVLPKYYC